MSPFSTRETVAAGLHCPTAVRRIWASLGCIIRDLQITFPLCIYLGIYNAIKSTELHASRLAVAGTSRLSASRVQSSILTQSTIHPFTVVLGHHLPPRMCSSQVPLAPGSG